MAGAKGSRTASRKNDMQSKHGFLALLKELTLVRAAKLVHRLLIILAAIFYATSSIKASIDIVKILAGGYYVDVTTTPQPSSLIAQYIGTESVRRSPIMQQTLGNSTSPITGMIYLEENGTSRDGCHSAGFSPYVYSSELLRSSYYLLVLDTAYVYTDLANMQLIVPVVDCSFEPLMNGDPERIRMYFLLRNASNVDDVYIASVRFSIQDYTIPAEKEKGPVALVSFALWNDMRATSVTHHFTGALAYPYAYPAYTPYQMLNASDDGFWFFETIPVNASKTAVKTIKTSRRTGFYESAESVKSNIRNELWELEADPTQALTQWTLTRTSVVTNSWAWTHVVHFYFAFDALFNLGVLGLLIYSNLRIGKIWVGDAFVVISNTLFTRGLIILISWGVESFWTLIEYCMYISNEISGVQPIAIYPNIMHADLLTLYLCALTIIGFALRERIDPALSYFVYEIAWRYRVALVKQYPAIVSSLTTLASTDKALGYLDVNAVTASTTPLRFWTIHKRISNLKPYLFSSIVPILVTMFVHVAYALVRKVYHHFHPETFNIQKGTREGSQDEQSLLSQKRTLTIFEIATGAALQNRVGVIADYENCWFIKGMKYASADGIFSSGFVIANGRYLIASVDLFSIILMKIIRFRFRNIHVFEVNGSTVKQTAQLVYPHTITWQDLANLNLSVLS